MASRQRERRRCLEVLGVQEDATDDDIRKAYKRMALIFHPDKNDSDDAKEKFQEVSYAYKYLTEGPSAVGFEEDGHFTGHAGGHDVPIEILIRLFPWMMGDFGISRPSPFGGLFGSPFGGSPFQHSPFDSFFMDPFGMHGFDDDDDDEEEIVVMQNGHITIINTGRGHGHSRRRKNRRRPRQHHDPFHDPFMHHFGHSRSHRPTQENVGSHSRHSAHSHNAGSQSRHSGHSHNVGSQSRHSGHSQSFSNRDHSHSEIHQREKNSSHSTSANKTRYSKDRDDRFPNMDQFTTDTSEATNREPFTTGISNRESFTSSSTCSSESPFLSSKTSGKQDNKSKKTKPQTVITSRSERKKQKKAAKKAERQAAAAKNAEDGLEEISVSCVIESESEDDVSQYDNMDDGDDSQNIPIKLNKKQRRRLKRERERLEKEMAEASNEPKPMDATVIEVDSSVDDDVISIASNDMSEKDSNSMGSKSRRARKNERKKMKSEQKKEAPLFNDLEPRSQADEEEMLRVAMEMSKMDMENIDDDSKLFAQSNESLKSDSSSQRSDARSHSSDTSSRRSSLYDNPSWYDDIDNASPFEKSPMEDMKKTYYKDLTSNFDPGSYYKTSQPKGFRSARNHQEEKENYDKGYHGYKQTSEDHSHHRGQRPSAGYSTRYFTSRNNNQPTDMRSGYQRPVDRHHEQYFKAPSSSSRKPAENHSFDLDEPDDINLNLHSNISRDAGGGDFHVRDVLDGSLNVPKGISVNHGKYGYRKK